ncbi:uncharacterized protein LOC143486096 isoform X2 [Brachyhypopomus gauderio]|uniref:uncharacterized protein LOC143486096 isoform X2 n=1 Tax=Brachyhypopomus gauderio TaxID=698409 RepID=UPI0040414A6E
MRLLTSELLWTLTGHVTADMIAVTGHVGGEVQIRCSHRMAGGNEKYFCTASCTGKDILVKSNGNTNPSIRGRFALFDEGSGVFIVTISMLRNSDSGTYWCGVKRTLMDTHHDVILTIEASRPTTPSTSATSHSLPQERRKEKTDSTDLKEREVTDSATPVTVRRPVTTSIATNRPDNKMVFVGAGLASVMFLLVLFLFIMVKQKNKHKKIKGQNIAQAQPVMNQPTDNKRNSKNTTTTSHQKATSSSAINSCSTSNQMRAQCLQKTPTDNEMPYPEAASVEYSTIMSAPDSSNYLNYMKANLTKEPDDLNYASVIFIRGSDVNNPTSPGRISMDSSHSVKDPDPVIYSTVRKLK